MCLWTLGYQKRALDLLEPELELFVCHRTWGTTFNCCSIILNMNYKWPYGKNFLTRYLGMECYLSVVIPRHTIQAAHNDLSSVTWFIVRVGQEKFT